MSFVRKTTLMLFLATIVLLIAILPSGNFTYYHNSAYSPDSSGTSPQNNTTPYVQDQSDDIDKPVVVEHIHLYTNIIIAPSCLLGGHTIYECECGYSYCDDFVDSAGHNYESQIIAPTCSANGYTLFTCVNCGDEYQDCVTNTIDHTFGLWSVVKSSTIWSNGVEQRCCDFCGHTEERQISSISGDSITLKEPGGMSDIMSKPIASDFGKYYKQAIILYESILLRDPGEYGTWPSGIYGPAGYVHIFLPIDGINELSYEEREVVASDTTYMFSGMFNQKVLNGVIWLGFGMHDVVDGGVSIHIDPASAHDRLKNQMKEDIYYSTNIEAGLYNGMSERDAVIAINNWICNNISYGSGSDSLTALTTKVAQCSGYASLFYQLCTNAGINCEYIVGCIDGDESCATCHAWNRVQIGDKWYWVDVCWNDTGSNRNGYLLSEELWSPRVLCK